MKKSFATITSAVVMHEGQPALARSGVRVGRAIRRYLPTVRGETRMPSLCFNWLAMRPSPHVTFSTAIRRISCRRFLGKHGLPVGLDFPRQDSRNPLRC